MYMYAHTCTSVYEPRIMNAYYSTCNFTQIHVHSDFHLPYQNFREGNFPFPPTLATIVNVTHGPGYMYACTDT